MPTITFNTDRSEEPSWCFEHTNDIVLTTHPARYPKRIPLELAHELGHLSINRAGLSVGTAYWRGGEPKLREEFLAWYWALSHLVDLSWRDKLYAWHCFSSYLEPHHPDTKKFWRLAFGKYIVRKGG